GTVNVIVDISEQKAIEKRLKESEKMYKSLSEFNKTLLEHSSVGIMNINKDMIVEYTNPEMRRILGLPFGKELDATWRDIREVPFFEETGISSLFEELKKGKEISKDVSFTFPGGEKGYVTLKGVPILKDSKFAGAVLIVNDITERKKMEEALQKEKDKAQKYLDVARVMIIVVGADQKITLINKKGCEILEGSEKEIVGKNWFDNFVPEKNRKKAKEDFEKLMRGEVKLIEYEEFSVLTKSGKEKIIAWRNALLKDEQGNIIGVLSSGSDITEKKKIEKELRESEKRFRDVALSSADWIWEVDKNGRYTFASGKVKQILGYDPEEIIGKTPLELMPKEEAERIGKILEKIVSEKKPIVDLENWNLTKEGEKVCLLTNGVPIIDEKGDLLGYRGVDKDIT
ncbi:MAG: PAS domain-containing protein, partial [Methanomicrobia archaeon]|nr:PAS domain-containing protein [Methanomicrobia archaeon]